MKSILFGIVTGGIFLLGACKKAIEVKDLDKQVNVYFGKDGINSVYTFFDPLRQSVLKDFDIREYKHIDSVTFNIGVTTWTLTDTAYVRLFNLTDQKDMANTWIQGSTSGHGVPLEIHSKNILHDLPQKKIDLAVQIRSSFQGTSVFGYSPYLKLRRN
jgi:hypothetical protein